jgi:hypothetical protein
MLMGQLPGSQALPLNNAYTGAHRFASAPLQPYSLPQPVPRPPVMSQPPAPVAALPAAIEAWRSRILAMSPWQLIQRFGMPAAQLQQLLADPQTATRIYLQTRQQSDYLAGAPQGGGGNRDHPGQRAADSNRAGFADFSLGNIASALGFGARALQSPLSVGLQAMGRLAFPGLVDSPMPQFAGEIDVRDIAARSPEIAAALRDLELEPNAHRAIQKKARLERQIREFAERETMAKRGLGSGGWGMPGATEARDFGSGAGSRGGSGPHGGGSASNPGGGKSGRAGSTADRNDR